jgi:orotate phosphoribosyltransferase-like protein
MAWSYDPTDLDTTTASGRLNTVRLLVGDTETLDQQVQNEEITFGLSENGDNIYYAGAWIARAISSKYSRKVNTSLDGALSADYSDLAKQYKVLADDLEYQGKTSGAVIGVLAGGITKSGINAVRANTNRVEGSFRRDRFKNPPSYETPEYE